MRSLFNQLFMGDDWMAFLDPCFKLNISSSWYHQCNITASSPTTSDTIKLNSLLLTNEQEMIEMQLHQLVSEIELALYGCSGGAD